jgi:hypothetical protein
MPDCAITDEEFAELTLLSKARKELPATWRQLETGNNS